jgi:type II restriction enzyme
VGDVRTLITRWRDDPSGTYQSWFLWDERLKNFGSIRRGLAEVIREIEADTFGNMYKGSSLETVVGSIAEQRQIFRGADHAFLWKPKLRIPDIYENRANQMAFGQFLAHCCSCSEADGVLEAIQRLAARQIKGLGPAAANLLYFLHPTIVPPFNTAIVKGYNALAGARVRLGRWDDYLAMRGGILRLNSEYRDLLSNDLGAIAGLLFDMGAGRYHAPPSDGDEQALKQWEADLAAVRTERTVTSVRDKDREADRTHTQIQGWLRDLGVALGFAVYVAANDRSREYGQGLLGDGCLNHLPDALQNSPGADAIGLIDVLWFDDHSHVAAAFEVEHTTSIYSGIVRLLDLAMTTDQAVRGLFLVAPDSREPDVRAQLTRPAFRAVSSLQVRFLPYSELERHRESMARFGEGLKAIEAIARTLA